MRELIAKWRNPEAPVRSVAIEAAAPHTAQQQPQFRLLVRHLLHRFFNNETLSVGGEALPLMMTIAGAIAIPTLIAAIFTFPAYHAFPPRRPIPPSWTPIPPFWNRTSEHLFYVVYSFVAMGVITVLEAEMLFPNPLDIFILSTLPIPHRRFVLARVSATLVFLVLFLFGINSLGICAYPVATEFHAGRLFLAQLTAVTAAGAFAAATVLAIQGVLICLLSGRIYRVISTVLQGLSIAVLMTVLLSFRTMYQLLPQLAAPAGAQLRYYPPYWFLGIYERVLAGPQPLPAFSNLAHTAWWATLAAITIAVATYPLAYIRRTRQAVEGTAPRYTAESSNRISQWILHSTILRSPARRAIYSFIGQTIRTPRHRTYLAVYAGLGLALMIASTVGIRAHDGQLHIVFSTYGLQAQVPVVAFWTVSGLCSALISPADPRGGWLFRVIDGPPTPIQLDTVRLWVTVRALAITFVVMAALYAVSPPVLHHARQLAAEIVVGAGLCILLPDAMLLKLRAIPFTETRIPLNTDLAFLFLRYIVVLPALVVSVVECEPWISASSAHLLLAAAAIALLHALLQYTRRRILAGHTYVPPIAELNGAIEPLMLRE